MMNFSSSDEDLENVVRLIRTPKNENYFEDTVTQFTNEQFRRHFRLIREVVQQLATTYEQSEYWHYQQGDSEKINPLKIITTYLWFASNEAAGYRVVADRFDMSVSSLHKIVQNVTYFLSNMSVNIIKWPTIQEKVEIERHFRAKDFPGVIGVIDGTHVKIDKPQDDPDSYLNRKHFYSIQAQIVCDHETKIRDCYIGYPGSVHDSRVFRTSPLFNTLEEKCAGGDYFIIGDSGYPCLRHCLTPFRDTGALSRRQRNYNYILSKNRYIIEHCFGLLKQKFRQLYHIKMQKIQTTSHFIRAMCVLHNLSLDGNLELQEQEQAHEEAEEGEMENFHVDNQDDLQGTHKRNQIMNMLPFRV